VFDPRAYSPDELEQIETVLRLLMQGADCGGGDDARRIVAKAQPFVIRRASVVAIEGMKSGLGREEGSYPRAEALHLARAFGCHQPRATPQAHRI
jgi:hypothetical protein